uniref:MTOR-associated protein MEAK7 n=1 Tax=Setaria digitata TaxID=48799 RepID=A0A915Q1H5_9BILA
MAKLHKVYRCHPTQDDFSNHLLSLWLESFRRYENIGLIGVLFEMDLIADHSFQILTLSVLFPPPPTTVPRKKVKIQFTESTMSPQLQSLIYNSISIPDNTITMKGFVEVAEMMLGDFDQQAEVLLKFGHPIKELLEAVISSFFKCEELDRRSIPLLLDYFTGNIPSPLDLHTLSKFMKSHLMLPAMIKHISKPIFLSSQHNMKLLPQTSKNSLLTPAALCLVYGNLPEELRDEWKLLFSSEKHGESFTKLIKSVDGAGPCLIIIETTSDRVFGAFASQGFICGPRHTGDSQCFLFEDRQKLHIYNATNYNRNFGYLNSGQVSLPNGLGMGGQGENWSFFLHEDFDNGSSTSGISTFQKCWLANETTFKVKKVEIWLIGGKDTVTADSAVQDKLNQQRALTNKNETRLMLELSGKEFHGDAFKR